MIFITVKWPVKPEHADQWLDLVKDFTEATRAEPGNLWFDWSRSVDDPNEYVLVEAFQDDAAEAHVSAPHFK
ncbi:MAG TPA: putative quinol monooxygenase, partial [Nakamurella multipartita]|nr:putative quinol monooxygenase [Nakamurella multipartita]